ncbi:MAG: T9SS type A sorting domain-containing protein [Bacteroidetes bacterium]|nr:MAG: T9SS type A sorting domain-containing protein [Bacteroidota bacterium]
MKTKFTLPLILLFIAVKVNSQVLFNEVYTDPGGNKHEFFELYNTNTSSAPESLDNYTLVTFFEYTGGNGDIGFYVMDLPNLSVLPRGYFVGSAAIPFSCQGITNSTASDFNWNSTAFRSGSTGGYLKKWVYRHNDLSDGNPDYDEGLLPADFNDFFYRRNGIGASYTMFLYKNGVMQNGVIFGTGGYAEVIPIIIGLPKLYINMSGSAPDFEIDFSTYGTVRIENVIEAAGSDNGYMREADGKCGGWLKSSSQAEHTPHRSNGTVDGNDGVISVSTAIVRGNAINGSVVTYDVVSAPTSTFPITMEVYNDRGPDTMSLDGVDLFIASNSEAVVSDGPFNTTIFPNTANVLVVVKSNIGCIDKVLFVPNVSILPVKLISFNGNMNNDNIKLNWETASNEQAGRYEIERSLDGKNFENAKMIAPTGKNGNEQYDFEEEATAAKVYYRLRVTDKSGIVTYSKILGFSKAIETTQSLTIIGNNVTDKITVSVQSEKNQPLEISVVSMNGNLIAKQRLNVSKGNTITTLSLPSAMNSGIYIARLAGENINSTARFIKQ